RSLASARRDKTAAQPGQMSHEAGATTGPDGLSAFSPRIGAHARRQRGVQQTVKRWDSRLFWACVAGCRGWVSNRTLEVGGSTPLGSTHDSTSLAALALRIFARSW